MPRRVACRRCKLPGPTSLCAVCRGETYDSPEYRRNAALVVAEVRRRWSLRIIVRCIICDLPLIPWRTVTVEHIRSVSHGGTNALSNLAPAHPRCNYAKKAVSV